MTSMNTDRIGGNLIPEGIHNFVVTEFEERTGPSGDYWNFTCKVVNSPFEGKQCWVVISLTPQSRWKAEQWLDCFEIPEGMEIEGDDFIGLAFRGKVIHEEGKDGKTRAKIDEFLPAQKVKLTKSAAVVKPTKKVVEPEEDEDDTEEEEASDESDEDTEEEDAEDEEDEDEEEEEEQPKKPVKATTKPYPVKKSQPAAAPKGKLPKPKSKFKRPF